MHGEGNKYDCFNNLIEMIVEIREIALFTRATPGSSLVISYCKCAAHEQRTFFTGMMKY